MVHRLDFIPRTSRLFALTFLLGATAAASATEITCQQLYNACRGHHWSRNALARLEATRMIPVLDRSDSLAGPDSNHNGIRDDTDAFLDGQSLPQPRRLAANQLARGMQEAVVVNSANITLTSPIAERISKAVTCVWARFPTVRAVTPLSASQMVRSIEKFTANTRSRVTSYLLYNGSLNGSVSTSSSGDGCAD